MSRPPPSPRIATDPENIDVDSPMTSPEKADDDGGESSGATIADGPVDRLEALLAERNREIARLRREVDSRDAVIDALRARLSSEGRLATSIGDSGGRVGGGDRSGLLAPPPPSSPAPAPRKIKGAATGRAGRKRASKVTNLAGSEASDAASGNTPAAGPSPSVPASAEERGRKNNPPSVDTEKRKQYRAKMQERWASKLEELREYKARFGHCNVPQKWKENSALGGWVNRQREYYRAVVKQRSEVRQGSSPGLLPKIQISDERIAQLNALGFCWNVNEDGTKVGRLLTEQAWEDRIRELIAYRDRYGDCLVPNNWKGNQRLANFVSRARRVARLQQQQRQQQQDEEEEKPDSDGKAVKNKEEVHSPSPEQYQWLSPEQIKRLDEIGFVWSIRCPNAENWESKYQRVKAYKEQFGNCRVPGNYDKVLNLWILTQRQYYKNTMDEAKAKDPRLPTLNAEKIIKLQRIGFEWEVAEKSSRELWETRFRDLITFRSEHGHCLVPKIYRPNTKLGNWVYEQRRNYKSLHTGKGRGRRNLTDERIRRLEEIGFQWSGAPPKNYEPQQPEQEVAMQEEEGQLENTMGDEWGLLGQEV